MILASSSRRTSRPARASRRAGPASRMSQAATTKPAARTNEHADLSGGRRVASGSLKWNCGQTARRKQQATFSRFSHSLRPPMGSLTLAPFRDSRTSKCGFDRWPGRRGDCSGRGPERLGPDVRSHSTSGTSMGPISPARGRRHTPAFPATRPEGSRPRPGCPRGRSAEVNLRFQTGDAIALEAWVRVSELKDGAYAYLVGKGRTRAKGFPEKNQNYALRLFGKGTEARVSFLFASTPDKDRPADWHRWTTDTGFPLGDGWHHVAVEYTFGKPKSVRGFSDGKVVGGTWDMGGATDRAPVTDADDLQLGTGNGGGAGNSFRGWLDDVAIWRGLSGRDTHRPLRVRSASPGVAVADVPKDRVLVSCARPGCRPERLAREPADTNRDLHRGIRLLPRAHKYVDTGVRGDRRHPYLFRALRVTCHGKAPPVAPRPRASRLYIDGKLVLSTPFPPSDSDGHHARSRREYLNLGPDFRFAPPKRRSLDSIRRPAVNGRQLERRRGVPREVAATARNSGTVVAVSLARSTAGRSTPGSRTVAYRRQLGRIRGRRNAHFDRVDDTARAAKRTEPDYWPSSGCREGLAAARHPVPPLPTGYRRTTTSITFWPLPSIGCEAAGGREGTTVDSSLRCNLLGMKCLGCHAGANRRETAARRSVGGPEGRLERRPGR